MYPQAGEGVPCNWFSVEFLTIMNHAILPGGGQEDKESCLMSCGYSACIQVLLQSCSDSSLNGLIYSCATSLVSRSQTPPLFDIWTALPAVQMSKRGGVWLRETTTSSPLNVVHCINNTRGHFEPASLIPSFFIGALWQSNHLLVSSNWRNSSPVLCVLTSIPTLRSYLVTIPSVRSVWRDYLRKKSLG